MSRQVTNVKRLIITNHKQLDRFIRRQHKTMATPDTYYMCYVCNFVSSLQTVFVLSYLQWARPHSQCLYSNIPRRHTRGLTSVFHFPLKFWIPAFSECNITKCITKRRPQYVHQVSSCHTLYSKSNILRPHKGAPHSKVFGWRKR